MLVLLPILVTYIWRLCAKSSRGIIHIDASARIYIYNYRPYLLFWPALLLGLACSWSVVLSPVIVLFLFLANDDFDLSSTTSSTAGPSSSSPVVLMMRHPSSLDATLTLQPITSSKSWAAMSALMRYHEHHGARGGRALGAASEAPAAGSWSPASLSHGRRRRSVHSIIICDYCVCHRRLA